MRYRRLGQSELEVSEVGFGTWTIASDWWGVVDDKQAGLDAPRAGADRLARGRDPRGHRRHEATPAATGSWAAISSESPACAGSTTRIVVPSPTRDST